MNWLDPFFASPTGLAVKGLLVGAFLVFALGAVAAIRDGTFDLKYVDAFVRSTVMGRVVPILLVLAAGYLTTDPILTTAGVAAAGLVAAGMIASVLDSIKQLSMPKVESAAANAPPVE